MIRFTFLLALVLTVAVVTPHTAAADDADEGMEIYKEFCLSCHGPEGNGDGPAADVLKKSPAKFSDCETMEKKTDDELRTVITNGGEAAGLSSEMAAWKDKLDPEEIDMLIRVVRGFCKK